jgi:arylsulfatase A-like enzyme
MPFIVRWPGVVKAGSTSDQVVGFVDMIATAADWSGATLPPDAAEDSFSFLPVLLGKPGGNTPLRDHIVLHAPIDDLKAIRVGDWKLIDGPGSGGFSDRFVTKTKPVKKGPSTKGQLYNLRDDPGESRNLWDEKPEIVRRLSDRLREAVTHPATAPRARRQPTPVTPKP